MVRVRSAPVLDNQVSHAQKPEMFLVLASVLPWPEARNTKLPRGTSLCSGFLLLSFFSFSTALAAQEGYAWSDTSLAHEVCLKHWAGEAHGQLVSTWGLTVLTSLHTMSQPSKALWAPRCSQRHPFWGTHSCSAGALLASCLVTPF